MGHMFNCCPFVDDKLKHLLKEEVMNVHQPNLQITTTILLNVSILGTQAMNPSICHMIVPINYQTLGHNLLQQLY
jgi:hypothetical protein